MRSIVGRPVLDVAKVACDARTMVVVCAGELDNATVVGLREVLYAVIRPGSIVVVDLNGVTIIDSAGLGLLVGACKKARRVDCRLALIVTRTATLTTMRITGLHKVFDIHPDATTALDALAADRPGLTMSTMPAPGATHADAPWTAVVSGSPRRDPGTAATPP